VDSAADGAEAWERFRLGTYDLVVTDRAMPRLSGDQLAPLVKRLRPDVPVVLLTGFGDFMNATGEQPEGVDVVLGKPVTMDRLRAAISQALAARRADAA
jgi:DNA-binding NtrC family response regulator